MTTVPERLVGLAMRIAAADRVWRAIVRHDPRARWYLRLARTDDHEAWLLGWTPGQATALHDHGASAGAFVVTDGELFEDRFDERDGRLLRVRCPAGSARPLAPGAIHRLGNAGPTLATSIHVYAPPLATMAYYEPDPHGRLRRKGSERLEGPDLVAMGDA